MNAYKYVKTFRTVINFLKFGRIIFIKIIFSFAILAHLSACLSSRNETTDFVTNEQKYSKYNFPESVGFVNDFAAILTQAQRTTLEAKLKNYDQLTTNQIAVVTINDKQLNGENFDDFALALMNNWGVGSKNKNNG